MAKLLTLKQKREIYQRQNAQNRRDREDAERSKRKQRLLGKFKRDGNSAADNSEVIIKFALEIANNIPTKRMREKLEELITARGRGFLHDQDAARLTGALGKVKQLIEHYINRLNPDQRCPTCGALKKDLELTPEQREPAS
jgi:hypothetical protein